MTDRPGVLLSPRHRVPRRGETVVELRPERAGDAYKSVYSALTRPSAGTRVRSALLVAAEVAVTVGLVAMLFAAYQVFGDAAEVQQAQGALGDRLDRQWSDPTVGPAAGAPGGDLVGRLYIPKLGQEWVIVEGVTQDDIRFAPGHYPGTARPGQVGNFSVAGHRSRKIFWRLDELAAGDLVGVETRSSWYVYQVTTAEVVKPGAVEVVAPVPGHPGVKPTRALLTLTTCHPLLNNYQRLIVHARLVRTVKRDPALPDAGRPFLPATN